MFFAMGKNEIDFDEIYVLPSKSRNKLQIFRVHFENYFNCLTGELLKDCIGGHYIQFSNIIIIGKSQISLASAYDCHSRANWSVLLSNKWSEHVFVTFAGSLGRNHLVLIYVSTSINKSTFFCSPRSSSTCAHSKFTLDLERAFFFCIFCWIFHLLVLTISMFLFFFTFLSCAAFKWVLSAHTHDKHWLFLH